MGKKTRQLIWSSRLSSQFEIASDSHPLEPRTAARSTERGIQVKQGNSDHWFDQIDILFMEFTNNQMLWKPGWWIKSYKHMYPVRDRINRTITQGLKEAGIVLLYGKGG